MWAKRKKVILAGLGSVLLHVLVFSLFALMMALRPAPQSAPEPTPEPEPIKMEVVEEDKAPPVFPAPGATPSPTPKQVVLSDDMTGADSPPPDAKIESDRNTRASNNGESNGDQALPSQKGRKAPLFAFDPRRPEAGPTKAPPLESAPAPDTAPPLPQPDKTSRAFATPPPMATPASEAKPPPTPAPDEFAMLDPTPSPTPDDPFDPSFRSTAPPLPVPVVQPPKVQRPAAPRNSNAGGTATSSNIVNRGTGGVDAAATPRGRYTRSVSDTIRFLWHRALDSSSEKPPVGTVVVRFTITSEGRVIEPEVMSNTANDALAALSLQAIMKAQLPPIPPDYVRELDGAPFTMDITFDYYNSL